MGGTKMVISRGPTTSVIPKQNATVLPEDIYYRLTVPLQSSGNRLCLKGYQMTLALRNSCAHPAPSLQEKALTFS